MRLNPCGMIRVLVKEKGGKLFFINISFAGLNSVRFKSFKPEGWSQTKTKFVYTTSFEVPSCNVLLFHHWLATILYSSLNK